MDWKLQYSQRRRIGMGLALNRQPLRNSSDERPNMCNLRIVFLGKNVSENIRVRNLILGIDVRESEEQQPTVIPISRTLKDRHVMVMNTHHLLNPNISDHQISQTVRECVNMSTPGPHAFILVLQYSDFTEEDMRRVKQVLNKFSEEAIKRTIVLTTDTLRGFMKKHTAIHELIKECGGEHLQLDERELECQSRILKAVDKILKRNKEEHLTCELYEDVKGTSVDVEQIRSDHSFRSDEEYEDSSHHKDYGKPQKRSEASISDQSPERNHPNKRQRKRSTSIERPSMSLNVSGKQKLNLVLCGRDLTLKVSLSKLLRGKPIKPSHQRASSEECVKKEERIHGRLVSLVDLPALSQLSEEEVMRQTLCCVSLCDPGVHVFLLIVPVGPLTDEDRAEIQKIQKIFYSREHFILLFTSELTDEGFALDFVKSRTDSQRLIRCCGGQYRVIGLNEPENSRQIPDLLDYIENMKTEPYSLQMYVKAQENRVRHELEEHYKKELSEKESKIKELKEKIQSEGPQCDADDQENLRIVLIGRTGSGKSATGNTILGREEFESDLSSDSVTTVCHKGVGEVDGRSVAVVDTPGLFDTELTNDQVIEEIMKCVSLLSPGPHVFVIVLSLGRFTREEGDTMTLIKKIFGHKSAQFSIVLFTGGDKLKKPIKKYVRESKNAELKKLIRDCGNRFLVFNNTENQDRTQVTQLLNMIEEVKNSNQGRYFTNSMFEEAEMNIKKRMEDIMKEREREIQEQREELQAKYEMDMKNMMKRLEEEKQRAEEERIQREHDFRQKEENLMKDFEEKEKTEQKKREIENQRQSEEEKQQRTEYHQKIEEMKRELENQRSQYEKQQKEKEEEDRKKEEKYRQDQEKMKNDQERIIAELQRKQEEELKKRESEEKIRNEEEEKERQEWVRKIKEAENDRKETKEEIERQQRKWEEEKKRQMREREEEERKRKEKHEEQLKEKQEELEKMRERFEREREEERQKIEAEREKQRREREEKERDYEEKKHEMKRHYEQLEQKRKVEWERRKREDDERREEERKRWKKKIEDLKQEQEEEIERRETEEKERKEREEKERDEMKQKHEEEIKVMKKKHEDEARKQAEELNDLRERKEELKEKLEEQELLEKLHHHFKNEKSEEVNNLKMEIENLKKTRCRLM